MTNQELIDECVRLRTITRMHDAETCTSYEEEIASLLRYHHSFDKMGRMSLQAAYEAALLEVTEIE